MNDERRGAGSMRKLASGKWNLRASAGTDPITGKRLVITETMPKGTSKSTAEKRLGELVNRKARKTGAVTVQAVVDAYHDLTKLERATREKHKSVFKHIHPGLWKARADQLTRRDISLLYKRLSDAGVGDSTIRAIHGALGAAFQQAFLDDWIPRNPVSGAIVPAEPESRAGTIAEGDLRLLAEAAGSLKAPIPLWLRILITTGVRCGEAIALRWSSLDGDRLTVDGSIERSIERTRKKPKSNKRTLTLDPETLEMAQAWRRQQRELAVAAPDVTLARDPYLFADDLAGTTPWRADHKTFAKIRALAVKHPDASDKLHKIRQHDVRHAYASDLLASGMDLPTVAYLIGDDPRTVLRVYAHMIKGKDREAAEMAARRLG